MFKGLVRGAFIAFVVCATVGGTAAWASIPAADRLTTGCYNNNTGALRVIDASRTKCFAGTTQVKWSPEGVPGVTGPQGPPGFPGFAAFAAKFRPGSPDTNVSAAFLGPLLAGDESSALSEARDGGLSVPLPNGKDFWVFGDDPRYQYQGGQWNLTHFIHGSTAATVSFTDGSPPTAPLQEVAVGSPNSPYNQSARQFLPSPRTYLPDGTGRVCNSANAGRNVEAVRWATGASLMPDQTNVFISYVDVCVLSEPVFTVEGWGFTEYDWKANKFSVGATDVFTPAPSGAAIPTSLQMGSPIVANNTVTLFSETCCTPGSVYTTTVATDVAALTDPASYIANPVPGLPATFLLSVAPPTASHPNLTMYWASDTLGQYRIFTAANPSGPWTQQATGALPRCDARRSFCSTIHIHPELSSPSQLLVSYNLPGYGPGIAAHSCYLPPDHLVWASIPTH